MIRRIIEASITHRGLVILVTLGLAAAGAWSAWRIDLDAVPDLSDVQVILRSELPGQAPQIVEDQLTYPLTTSMLAVPGAESVRGYSMFGTSFVYVIFEDGTPMGTARSRVLEQLASVQSKLPETARVEMGPYATAIGWIYQYVLDTGPYCREHPQGLWLDPQTDRWFATVQPPDLSPDAWPRLEHHRVFPGRSFCPLDDTPLAEPTLDLADLRSVQQFQLGPELTAVDGVAEVAPVGGFIKQYQVVVDPVKLLAHDIPLEAVLRGVRRSNREIGGRTLEFSETEYMVRGRGYLGTAPPGENEEGEDPAEADAAREQRVLDQLRQTALRATPDGSPIRVADVAEVRVGPEIRRGILEWNGQGETAGGIVIMRYGDNALTTIDRVRQRLDELQASLPPGVVVRTGYDRSDLIRRGIDTLSETLIKEMAVVGLVMLLFLLHARSALVAAVVLPVGVLMSLGVMHALDLSATIMSLGGIAIAIGVMVDASVVMVENAHKHLEDAEAAGADTERPRERLRHITAAAIEVGPLLFASLLIITISFLPVFLLGGESGRLFRPLAYTKTFSMAAAALLAVTLIPALIVPLVRHRVLPARWRWWKRWLATVGFVAIPAVALWLVPEAWLMDLAAWRAWLVAGWVVLAAVLVLPQRIVPESRNPFSLVLERLYAPVFAVSLRLWPLTLLVAVLAVASGAWAWQQLGREFMPPLKEGDLLYMPTTTEPGLSMTKAKELLQQTDRLMMQFPEVASVMGKIGRAQTATDPAPLNMIETTIRLNRDRSQWRQTRVPRFYDDWPQWLHPPLRYLWPHKRPITTDELLYGYRLPGTTDPTTGQPIRVPGLNDALNLPGLANAWTMPIRTRIDMLATGIKTPVGIKLMGPDLQRLAQLSDRIANVLRSDERTASYTASATADKSVGGKYLDVHIDRAAIARYGLSVGDVQDTLAAAIGGQNVTQTVEGLARFPVNVRYPRELRSNLPRLRDVMVATPAGGQVPLGQLASLHIRTGPPMIKSENARPSSWVYVEPQDIDVGGYVDRAQQVVRERVSLPSGYSLVWSGQHKAMQEARSRLTLAIPMTLGAIVVLLYAATRSWLRVTLVVLTLSTSLVGAVWFVWLLDYDVSLAVVVGMIALLGLDAETSLIILLYLDKAYDRAVAEGRMNGVLDLWTAVYAGAVQRIRPKTMTVLTSIIGLMPLMFADGAGADTLRRLAAPMIGGLTTSFLSELILYPLIYYLARRTQHALTPVSDATNTPV